MVYALWDLTPSWTRLLVRLRGSTLDFCRMLLAYVPAYELVNHSLLLFESASVEKDMLLKKKNQTFYSVYYLIRIKLLLLEMPTFMLHNLLADGSPD